MVWQRLDGLADIALQGGQGLAELGLRHQAGDMMVAGRLLPLSEHDLHPAVDTKQVVTVLLGMSMIAV